MTISTWHAAKGTQRRICVVMGMEDEDGPMNPAYVALTRGMQRLIVVMDQQSPSKRVISALKLMSPRDVLCDATTRSFIAAKEDLTERARFQFTRELISLDEWRPPGSGRWLTKLFSIDSVNNEVEIDEDSLDADIDEEDEIVAGLVGDHEDVDIRKQVNLDAYSETNLELRRQVMHDHTYRALVRQVYDLLEDKEAGAIKKQTYVPARAK